MFGGSAGGVRGWVCDCCCGRGSTGEAMVRFEIEEWEVEGLEIVEVRDGGRGACGGGSYYGDFIVVGQRKGCGFENNMCGGA